jgi:4a-hydroxytetrahydrobiopterin dehydratase
LQLLSIDKIKNSLQDLKEWSYSNNSIQKTFVLADFATAIALVVKIGIVAEKLDHHPDLFLHGWNKVTVTISTHSANGVTGKDFELAHKIERQL